jgi:Uncharacterized conserved protein (DUF2075)
MRLLPFKRSGYCAEIEAFKAADPQAILGELAKSQIGDLTPAQRDAWLAQIEVLHSAFAGLSSGMVLFEFLIPRMGKRADNLLLIDGLIFVIEFKVGAARFDRSAETQAVDYALDLKNFHAGSHNLPIMPVVVATRAPSIAVTIGEPVDGVFPVCQANSNSLGDVVRAALTRFRFPTFDFAKWLQAGYHPTPTIIEASQVLYREHSVVDITRMEAGADNLGATTGTLEAIIDETRATGTKAICFVTGVPGAGKTLAGLNLVSLRRGKLQSDEEHAVFLSGNGPLVKVLQEALARDEVERSKINRERCTKGDAHRHAHAFIQNIHHFRDEHVRNPQPPIERVVVFDEAQRAWNERQTSNFMVRKKGLKDFNQSEPGFLISVMDRHTGWSVIICLVGGGQEINTGEAGLKEWFVALRDRFSDWNVYMPKQESISEFLSGFDLLSLGGRVSFEQTLHLSVSLRSFRSERLSTGVSALLDGIQATAYQELATIQKDFPIVITRSLSHAKRWIRSKARGSERFGLLASSAGMRLKPIGVTMQIKVDPCVWFLNNQDDVRSSNYLEDAASEFDVQGLELDWSVVVWDADMIRRSDNGWTFRAFKGTKWQKANGSAAQYRLNAYRVLLTRARQGMAIVVPEGDSHDPTRDPKYYEPTWEYLCELGLSQLTK